ncbi:MAG TPA: PEGA domain-containing protein [Methanoregulaceae archaeon]|nr:MAG: PEGA domain-containing protein [Methanolinea sp.]HON82033.1 PEGA domain-containing protein [Methanoregulaceae archaeon]HRT15913.1 PEGA domain-containing protein [Methanoregulaceae archaeon]HRU31378.1 PEGA domain-containing protein [Methanoregulaceae archaeon]
MQRLSLFAVAILVTLALGGAGVQSEEVIGGEMGTYRIHCNVERAKVHFDGDYQGEIAQGILEVPVYVTGTPYQTFTIEKEGYRSYTGPITSVPVKGRVIDIYAQLTALPLTEYATLHLLVSPTLATVYYDGNDAGAVPPNGILIIRDVVPGNHLIQVSKEGYVTQDLDLHVERNEIKKVPVNLEKVVTGPLTVSSDPPGATIYLDGQMVGTTPLTLTDTASGEHTLTLTMEGYSDFSQTITVTRDGSAVSATLVPSTIQGRVGLSPLALLGALMVCAFLACRKG